MNTPATVAAQQAKRSLLEEFIFGAKNGFYLGVEKIIPAMILAYVLILFLKITGLMAIIGNVISPVMAIFGLPGEAIVALISAFFAKAAGAATAATLYADGTINAVQATILFPATITMGTLIGHFVRCVVASGANPKHHPMLVAIPIIDAVLSMLLTRMIITFMGIA
ncbi:nucleoside recognition protein [Candidatus Saccharibacteria bacterium]|nr:nucleoside recognition protein [Candidatus Saccharibacteria bacterium]